MKDRPRERRGGDDVDLGELTDVMMDWALLFAAAAVLGIALHLALRASGLGWSWGLPLLALAAPVFLASREAGLVTAVCASSVVAIGYAWHRADLERGGEEAQRARERPGPLTLTIARGRLLRARRERIAGDRLALGVTTARRVRMIPFGSRQGVRGMLVGAPGSGKTVTTAAIASAYISRGLPVVCVDPKGDPSLRDQLRSAATREAVGFREWSHRGPSVYNPLSRGSATEIADKALAGEEWSEPHYLRQAQRYLGWELRALKAAEVEISLPTLAGFMDARRLEALSDNCPDELAERLRSYLGSLSDRQRADLGGVRDRLAVLAESELGYWLDPAQGDGPAIDLAAAWRECEVVYFRLDADRYPLASEMLGGAIVSDLVALTGELQGRHSLGLVAIDEFSAIGARRRPSGALALALGWDQRRPRDSSPRRSRGCRLGGLRRRVCPPGAEPARLRDLPPPARADDRRGPGRPRWHEAGLGHHPSGRKPVRSVRRASARRASEPVPASASTSATRTSSSGFGPGKRS